MDRHEHATELAAISELLDAQPRLAALIQQDLLAACSRNPRTGRPGLTGDQALRIMVARQLNGWTYAELEFHLADSVSYRTFCRVGSFGPAPSKSALAANLRRVRPQTLAKLNALLVTSEAARKVETGCRVRIDSTVVPVAIHHPTDSSLLHDSVRVLLRLLRRAEHLAGFTAYHGHMKRVKRRAIEIQHLAPQATGPRRAAYRDLLGLTQATVDYASYALAHIEDLSPTRALGRLYRKLAETLPLVEHVIAQATCRVLHVAFHAYVRAAVLTANLLTLARHRLAGAAGAAAPTTIAADHPSPPVARPRWTLIQGGPGAVRLR